MNLLIDLLSLLVDTCHLSPELRAIREESDVGIEAVPAGSYQETNPYLLLQASVSALLPVEPPPETINYLDWSQAGLESQDMLKVKLVEVATFNTLYLHPDDSSCQYLGRLLAHNSRSLKMLIIYLVEVNVWAKHQEKFQEFQKKCEEQPPVFQPR